MSDDQKAASRAFAVERLMQGQDVTYRVSLSSEAAVRDWPGSPPNVWMHDSTAVDLSGISERGLPLFVNHERGEIRSLVGRIQGVRLDGKRLVGELKFSRANPEAEMIKGMVDEGTLTDMSLTAMPIEMTLAKRGKDEVMNWTRWRPAEGSVVGIGADQSIGIGRGMEGNKSAGAEGVNMSDEEKAAAEVKAKAERGAAERIEAGKEKTETDFASRIEQERIDMCRKFGQSNAISEDVVQAWIGRGFNANQIADSILEIQKKRGEKSNHAISALDLTDRETKEYSLCRAILASNSENWKDAPFEFECHQAIADRNGGKIVEKGHFYVPLDIQRRKLPVNLNEMAQRHGLPYLAARDLTAGVASAGGFLTGTSVMGFDELLRNTSVVMRLGATVLSGLRDNITIPRQSAAATAEWIGGEATGPTESQQTFVQLGMSPKTVGASTDISRRLLLQAAIGVESLVNSDLSAVCALAVDLAALQGTGVSGQPIGLDNVTGIGTVSGSTFAFKEIIEFQTDLATANVTPARGGYATTPAVAGLAMARVKYSNTASPLWEGNLWNGTMQGFPAMSSNQIGSALMYFGDWSKLVVGEWGTLEIDTNPYGTGFGAGIITIRALYSVDVGCRLPAAFSRGSSMT